MNAESMNSSDQDAYPGLAKIFEKQEKFDMYLKT